MSRYTLSWKVAGEAGFGIKSAGLIFARTLNRAGYEAFGYVEYPSLIRGGHNTYQVTVAENVVRSAAEAVDVLVALNSEAVAAHLPELSRGAAIIFDKKNNPVSRSARIREMHIHLLDVPLEELAVREGGRKIMRNAVALGATQALIGLPLPLLTGVLKKQLGGKAHALAANLRAAQEGFEYVRKRYGDLDFKVCLQTRVEKPELLISGNEAIALGALAGGLQFYAAYPMTPSSSILHYLATQARSNRLIVKHAEDEISVINMALGASHVGARAMIGTSGGGFALMGEALGLAGITETPLVIVEAQRPGPATGLPTWTDQGDLRFVMHAGQGEFPRIVLAPGDHEECFYLTAQALNYADYYQTPVIILSDKFLSESERTIAPFDYRRVTIERGRAALTPNALRSTRGYRRYRVTRDGISPRSIPGTPKGMYLANSDEHDEYGFSCETSENRIAQVMKRAAKLEHAAAHIDGAHLYGDPRARATVIGWGSTKGPILDALAWLPPRVQKKINFLHLNLLWPFPSAVVSSVLRRSRRTLLIENNATAQLGGLVRQETGYEIKSTMLRFDGRPLYPIDIKERLMNL